MTNFIRISAFLLAILAPASLVQAGYEAPSFIDGCQSQDGRYVVVAEPVEQGKTTHGPNRWSFVWKDNQTGEVRTYAAQGVQAGQIYAQLFMAPDGKTFALWNHVTMWWPEKSNGHASAKLPPNASTPEWQNQQPFSRRLLIYRSQDGSLLKELSVADFLQPEEWDQVLPVFNRVHWIKDYPGLWFKSTIRTGYAFYRVSPDYTVLEFHVVPLRSSKDKSGRRVRVSLTDGRILPAGEELTDPGKIPVRPFQGPDKLESNDPKVREGYVASLDPVRSAGRFTVEPAPPAAAGAPPTSPTSAPATSALAAAPAAQAPMAAPKLELIQGGYAKLDTPAWLPAEKCLVLTDLDQKKFFQLSPSREFVTLREEACRGKVGPDGRFYGVFGGKLASWRPTAEPQVILEQAAGGRELSLNDIAIGGGGFLYFSTLKDPELGRLSVVNLAKKTVSVAFDGEEAKNLANPNGLALAPDGKFLYVGISNYKNRKTSGIYRFPIQADGSLDVASGGAKPWADVSAPDGLAIGPAGNLYATAGPVVVIVSPEGKKLGTLRIPAESGTNLTFGGDDGRTLFVTTNKALYSVHLEDSSNR